MNIWQKVNLVFKAISNIHVFILDFMGVLSHEVIYKISGSKLRMIARGGTTDKDEIAVVMSGYEYDLMKLKKMKDVLIFDIGAHIGSFSLFAYDYYRREGVKIYSFEPSRANYLYLIRNCKINNLPEDSVMTFNLAIGGMAGKAILDISKRNDSYFITNNINSNGEECDITTLSDFIRENNIVHIHILKIDIEGSEYEIFNHADSFYQKPR